MLRSLKNRLYFLVAWYFRFFASIRLSRWKPRIVVVTGSNGKTTTMHLIAAILGPIARYSYGANSSFGIPFDILGLKRDSYSPVEWIVFGIKAPLYAMKKPYKEAIYIVEADCDRPGEGMFLSSFLKPEVTVWLSAARTHTMNFDKSVRKGPFANVDDAIAYEFGYFLEQTGKLAIITENSLIEKQLSRTKAEVHSIRENQLERYEVGLEGTNFLIDGTSYRLPYLLPKETFFGLAAAAELARHLGKESSNNLSRFAMPPGRSSILKGVKDTIIIDSSYNANASSVEVFLRMIEKLPGNTWLVLGDLTEQGAEEKEEHEKIARMVPKAEFQKVVLVGPRLKKYALPILPNAISFENPRETLDYLNQSIQGGETLAFKGARFLEGIIEHLLANKADADKLCRREKIWQQRRAQWHL
jgi:UDP-N-acetylmuramoyl-tripeptide--D-alanyl-D-alanine ligase